MKVSMRFAQLMFGLVIYGLGIGLMVDAKIGIAPWDVFAQGIATQTGFSFGISSAIVSVLVLLAWIPLKQRMGIGTVLNALLIGVFADLWTPFLPQFDLYVANVAKFVVGMLIVGFATGLYLASKFGSGPRDGLMVGTQQLLGWPFWLVRTMYEGSVLTIGWLMGGQVREGTLIFAICIGYLMQSAMKLFGIPLRKRK